MCTSLRLYLSTKFNPCYLKVKTNMPIMDKIYQNCIDNFMFSLFNK